MDETWTRDITDYARFGQMRYLSRHSQAKVKQRRFENRVRGELVELHLKA